MKGRYRLGPVIIILALSLFWACTYATENAQGAADPKVSINGRLRQFETPPQIANDRVMVPLRFVIEDEALRGQVYWDAAQQKVALDCRGKYIEMYIGNRTARVDGKDVYFDSPPYIFNNRTYIPLRFLSESLGASVYWNQALWQVEINMPGKLEVLAYYYLPAREELLSNAHLFTDVAFRWFKTDPQGHLSYEYKDDYAGMLALARQQGLKTHASVVLMGKDPLHELLSQPKNRALLISNLLDEVNRNGYDGVNIDFELMGSADANLFTNFLQELKNSLGNKTLSVAVFARTSKDRWATPYEYARIGKIADRVVVMAYDYHYATSSAGAVAPLWWVKDVVSYMCSCIPREKILLGMPTYGYNWPQGANAATVTAKKLADIMNRYQVTADFDQETMSPHYVYWDENGIKHDIWMENEQSLKAKWEQAAASNLGGVSFWRIGTGFTDLYRVLEQNQ